MARSATFLAMKAENRIQAARDAALAGLGIAMFPAMVCGEDIQSWRLHAVLVGNAPAAVPVWILYPGGRYLAPAARVFVEFANARFRWMVESLDGTLESNDGGPAGANHQGP